MWAPTKSATNSHRRLANGRNSVPKTIKWWQIFGCPLFACLLLWITNTIFLLSLMFVVKLRCDALWCDVGSLWLWVWIARKLNSVPYTINPVCFGGRVYRSMRTTPRRLIERKRRTESHRYSLFGIILPFVYIYSWLFKQFPLGFSPLTFHFSFFFLALLRFWLLPPPLLFIILVVAL